MQYVDAGFSLRRTGETPVPPEKVRWLANPYKNPLQKTGYRKPFFIIRKSKTWEKISYFQWIVNYGTYH